ncbi:IS21-like element helper ATPase IstB [bacterium]|nr:IS21-like element helper ATPase IstB [bacterium]
MNVQSTIQKLEDMRLTGLLRAYKETMETGLVRQISTDELIAHMVQAEWDDRYNKKLQRLVANARFRYKAGFEEIDYSVNRNLDKSVMLRLASCDWIKNHQNVIVTGSTGSGKSFIASALGYQACNYSFKALYHNCSKLFDFLRIAKADGSYFKEMGKIEKADLLILDDFGLKPFDNQSRLILMEIIEDRHGRKSTIISSQLPVDKWFDIIGEPTIADAILDRIVHSSHRIELKGESMRKIKSRRQKV